jgi:hypothetical protein
VRDSADNGASTNTRQARAGCCVRSGKITQLDYNEPGKGPINHDDDINYGGRSGVGGRSGRERDSSLSFLFFFENEEIGEASPIPIGFSLSLCRDNVKEIKGEGDGGRGGGERRDINDGTA